MTISSAFSCKSRIRSFSSSRSLVLRVGSLKTCCDRTNRYCRGQPCLTKGFCGTLLGNSLQRMAPVRHTSRQCPHPVHASGFTWAFPRMRETAPAGQTFAHRPQPTQSSRLISKTDPFMFIIRICGGRFSALFFPAGSRYRPGCNF